MLHTNLPNASTVKALEARETQDNSAWLEYAESFISVSVFTTSCRRLIRSDQVTTDDADALAEQLRLQYPAPGFEVIVQL
jgi:hypothetical protein